LTLNNSLRFQPQEELSVVQTWSCTTHLNASHTYAHIHAHTLHSAIGLVVYNTRLNLAGPKLIIGLELCSASAKGTAAAAVAMETVATMEYIYY